METLAIVLMIALVIVIVIALSRDMAADKFEEEAERLKELNRKQSNKLREKGIQVDRLTKDLKKYQREEETKRA